MKHQLVQSEQAANDLIEITEYLTENAGRDTARRVIAAIRGVYEIIETNPLAGSTRHFASRIFRGLRVLVVAHIETTSFSTHSPTTSS